MCKDTQIKLSFLEVCALHPQISTFPRRKVLQEKQATCALLALHTAWMEECNLRLSLAILMNLGSHHIGVNLFVFAFLSSFRLPSAFWIGRTEMKEKRRRCQMGEAHHPQPPTADSDPHTHLHLLTWQWKWHLEERGICFLQHKAGPV